ncbi:uncharacterized protein K460DRAFT_354583 [Cucurbitaria berberidis CBS 394.84]|uniref:Uncharacterized protein n=1 Tax=Cucurbitaria berberidis CBS 394.84 TaxID=1168544 RepID=A0A9P4GFU6_9PLEO|nr:uncharacterized protein K460DRAFT_354583 [Cucurbitaria berberidis CBS 394.84]KAF1844696.1 hypothetical protein K460DRAFT_354583 [Cucurbitaria berberidis CBS 394.84]
MHYDSHRRVQALGRKCSVLIEGTTVRWHDSKPTPAACALSGSSWATRSKQRDKEQRQGPGQNLQLTVVGSCVRRRRRPEALLDGEGTPGEYLEGVERERERRGEEGRVDNERGAKAASQRPSLALQPRRRDGGGVGPRPPEAAAAESSQVPLLLQEAWW